jgi:hypothetical protein
MFQRCPLDIFDVLPRSDAFWIIRGLGMSMRLRKPLVSPFSRGVRVPVVVDHPFYIIGEGVLVPRRPLVEAVGILVPQSAMTADISAKLRVQIRQPEAAEAKTTGLPTTVDNNSGSKRAERPGFG